MISKLIDKIQKLWSKEWLLKLISVFVAALLWYYVGGEDIVEQNIRVPLEVINLPNDLIISNKHKRELEVTVRGPRSLIVDIGRDQLARQIDLSKATPGTRVEQIENDSVEVGRGLDVLRVQPTSIILSLDKLIKKEFPVNAVTTGSVKEGFVLENLDLHPDSITINGPQTILSQVDVLKTTPINVNGLSESVQLQIPLELNEALVDLIGETSVTADLTITYETVTKTFANVPVTIMVAGYAQKVEPPAVDITVRIPTLIEESSNPASLFTVTAVKNDEQAADKQMEVQVIPATDLTVPLTIVDIEPRFVKPLPPSESRTEAKEEQAPSPAEGGGENTADSR